MTWLRIWEGEYVNLETVERVSVVKEPEVTVLGIEFAHPFSDFPNHIQYQIQEDYDIVERAINQILNNADRHGGVYDLESEIKRIKIIEGGLKEIEERREEERDKERGEEE